MFIINVIFIESTPSLKISRERMQICTFILFYLKIFWPIFTAVLVYFSFQSILIKKYFSYLQFKIINYSLLQYLSFFCIVPQFLFILIQSSIVFGIVLQFFFHSTIVFPQCHSLSMVNLSSKAINLSKKELFWYITIFLTILNQSFLFFVIYHVFFPT